MSTANIWFSGQQTPRARRLVVSLFFVLICSHLLLGQSTKTANQNDVSAEKGVPSEDIQSPGSLEEEMKAKRAIKFAEKEHQENLDRARDLSDLGKALLESFKKNKALNREADKKLERLEKLTKKVRSEAGGSEDRVEVDKAPTDLVSALTRLAEVSESLRCKVEKTPRHVVSASVITEANVLLEVIDMVRNFSGLR